MKKIIRLTESDLARIVKKVIKEQDNEPSSLKGYKKEIENAYNECMEMAKEHYENGELEDTLGDIQSELEDKMYSIYTKAEDDLSGGELDNLDEYIDKRQQDFEDYWMEGLGLKD